MKKIIAHTQNRIINKNIVLIKFGGVIFNTKTFNNFFIGLTFNLQIY